jgi:hypothetical protein
MILIDARILIGLAVLITSMASLVGGNAEAVNIREKQDVRRTNPGAPKDNRNAFKHCGRSAKVMAAARYLRELARLVRPSN